MNTLYSQLQMFLGVMTRLYKHDREKIDQLNKEASTFGTRIDQMRNRIENYIEKDGENAEFLKKKCEELEDRLETLAKSKGPLDIIVCRRWDIVVIILLVLLIIQTQKNLHLHERLTECNARV